MGPPIGLIDAAFTWFWSRILSMLCGLIGHSNFFFARLFSAFGGLLAAAALTFVTVRSLVGASTGSGFWSILFLLTALSIVDDVRFLFKLAAHLERGADAGEIHLGANLGQVERAAKARFAWAFIALMLMVTELWFVGVFMSLHVGALYFVFDFRPKSKGRIRRLAESLARRVKRLRLPVPIPMPGHTPS